MDTLARFVIRPADDTGRGDLMLGGLLKTQNKELLAPGIVYEIKDVMGTLMIVPVGEAAIGLNRSNSALHVSWGSDVSHIVGAGGAFLLTRDEWQKEVGIAPDADR